MIHVDSSFAVDLIREQHRQRPGPASAWIEAHAGESLGMSVFVCCELELGARASAHPERELLRVRDFTKTFTIVFPDQRFAERFSVSAVTLQRRSRSVAPMDLLIATTALVDDVALVTANEKHFQVVPDLRVLSYR